MKRSLRPSRMKVEDREIAALSGGNHGKAAQDEGGRRSGEAEAAKNDAEAVHAASAGRGTNEAAFSGTPFLIA